MASEKQIWIHQDTCCWLGSISLDLLNWIRFLWAWEMSISIDGGILCIELEMDRWPGKREMGWIKSDDNLCLGYKMKPLTEVDLYWAKVQQPEKQRVQVLCVNGPRKKISSNENYLTRVDLIGKRNITTQKASWFMLNECTTHTN